MMNPFHPFVNLTKPLIYSTNFTNTSKLANRCFTKTIIKTQNNNLVIKVFASSRVKKSESEKRKTDEVEKNDLKIFYAMEPVVGVAIAVLGVVFVGSLIGLVLVCRHRYCHSHDLMSRLNGDCRPDVHLISGSDEQQDVELDDVTLHPNIEKILDDDRWIDDATGLIPHCLAILKMCHQLTERLVAMTMSSVPQNHHRLSEMIEVAKRISPRVDDVVRSMYPPLDARLLEARSTALILSVTHLTLVTRSVCNVTAFDWIEDSLAEMEMHLKILRDAALVAEECRTQTEIQTTIVSTHPSSAI